MRDKDQAEAQQLHEDFLEGTVIDHAMKNTDSLDLHEAKVERQAESLADALFHKHGSYAGGLLDACRALVGSVPDLGIIDDLIDVVYKEKAEDEASIF